MNRPEQPSLLAPMWIELTPQPICDDVLHEKYLKNGETRVEELFDRVARALASVEKPELRAEFERRQGRCRRIEDGIFQHLLGQQLVGAGIG